MTDQLQRFIFDSTDIRGELARVDDSYQQAIAAHGYPEPVARLLGEFLTAAALLSATIKFDGILTLQARSKGQVPLIMAEATSDQKLRAIARDADDADSNDFNTLLADGQLAISITPKLGKRYQGIVALEGSSLAQCLEQYFQHSEQLATRLWLCADDSHACGMLLQQLPESGQSNPDQRQHDWEHLYQLAQTLSDEEILTLPFENLLHRLYHQEAVRLFKPAGLTYQCSCSRQRTLEAIKAIGQTEAEQIVSTLGAIDINCEFCHQNYSFNLKDIQNLFNPPVH